jgi:3-hydroxyisobutyrate dehydrogenase-like beta-hydroxyacid dehydrogenase
MRVSVVGTGAMGSAIAEGLHNAGLQVTVHNRTAHKTAPLRDMGMAVASSAAEAISVSEMTILGLIDAAATEAVLSSPEVHAVLNGKKLLNIAATTPDEIASLSALAAVCGADLAEVGVGAYPETVRRREAHFTFASTSDSKDAWAAVLSHLGPRVHFAGPVGMASKHEMAILLSYFFQTVATAYSTAAAVKLDLPMELVKSALTENPTTLVASSDYTMPQMIARSYGVGMFSVDNFVEGSEFIIRYAKDLGLPVDILEAVRDIYVRTSALGFGSSDVAAIYECFVA